MYTETDYQTKKQLKQAVESGEEVRIYNPGFGSVPREGRTFLEGPHYPKPHKWYAQVEMKNGRVVSVK